MNNEGADQTAPKMTWKVSKGCKKQTQQQQQSNIAVFSEKTDVPHLPNQSMVEISAMMLWPWKLVQGHQNLISYWSCPIYIGLQIW